MRLTKKIFGGRRHVSKQFLKHCQEHLKALEKLKLLDLTFPSRSLILI